MSLGSNEIDLINSRSGSKHNAVRFYPADRCLLYILPLIILKSSASAKRAVRSGKITSVGVELFTQPDSGPFVLRTATTNDMNERAILKDELKWILRRTL